MERMEEHDSLEPNDQAPRPPGDAPSDGLLPEGSDPVTDPFAGPSGDANLSLPPTDESPEVEGAEDVEADPIELLLIEERPRFAFRAELRQAMAQFLELFPVGRTSSPGAGGVSLRALTYLFIVAAPAFILVGTVAAGFAAGLGNFVGGAVRMSTASSVLALLIDAATCSLIALGSSMAATWAARMTRCWNGILVAACASIGALLLGAATFLPLVGEVAFAPTDGWIGPFAISWLVMAFALLLGPTAAALLATANVGASRICPDTGRLLTSAIRVRFGLPEGLAAVQAIEEEAYAELAALDGLPTTVENFTELTLYTGKGAGLAVLELEARFWAEEGPRADITETSAHFRQARRWLVLSTAIEAEDAQKLMGLTWQALAQLEA
jgi:hypothetical protein